MRVAFGVLTLLAALLSGCASVAPPATSAGSTALSPMGRASVQQRGVTSVTLPNDLWERIRKGYAIADLDSDLVTERTQWYANKPDYLQRMSQRSERYLFHIVEELERRNMPTELALLPFVESAFNPQAISSARASGIWQFMPATGRTFDLKQNVFRDDRRDVQASTRAALDYLERLYKMFGDWHLALAAYNWGEGNVSKAIARNRRADLPTGYADLFMPMETRMYVPKLQAIKNIVGNPSAFNIVLPNIPNHPYFQSVPLPRDMDVIVAAKLAEVSVEDFQALNPAANRPVLLAAGMPTILLPWDNAEVFQRNYEASGLSRMATWTAWIAPSDIKVADAAKRTGMSEAEFRSINNVPPGMLIKAGSALLVPRTSEMIDDVTANIADTGRLNLSPEIVLTRTLVKVGKHDNIDLLAKRYNVSVGQVNEWNKLSANAMIKPGQQLVLFLPHRTGNAVAGKFMANKKTMAGNKGKTTDVAKAKKADTPVRVAKR